MSGRARLWLALALLALFAVAPFVLRRGHAPESRDLASLAGVARGRDVVLLTLDTTRYDHLGCYGYARDTSPTLDDLAGAGIRFELAYCAAPVTLPSHTSILTGQYPVRHGVRSNTRYRLGEEARTLAELLREAGYQTGAFVGAAVLDGRYGLGQGFDHYGDELASQIKEHDFALGRRDAREVVGAALEWLRRRDPARPSFAWLHFFDPHHPRSPSEELMRRFGRREVDLYDAEIRGVDDAVGSLRRELEELGIEPLWAVLSDHGEGLSEHGEEAHGSFAYETTTRVAFLLSGGGIPGPLVPSEVARQVDLLPTLLELLGLTPPAGLDGRSLLRGGADENEAFVEALLGREEYGWSPVYALVRERWKYVQAPRPELYDLGADPREAKNLVSAEPQRAEAMKRALQPYLDVEARASETPDSDPGHDQALSALGYVAGGGLAQPGEALPDPKDMLDTAAKLSRAKSMLVAGPARNPLGAFVLLEEVLSVNPANGDALSWLGREAWREAAKNPADPNRKAYVDYSRRAFERMLARAPDRPEGEFGLGLLAALRDDTKQAIAHYERALEIDPRHVESLENLMRMRYLRQEFAPAIELSERILAIDDGNREACQWGGLSQYWTGAYLPAIRLLERCLPARNPEEHNGLHFVLGECHHKSGNFEQALAHYAQVKEPDRSAQGVPALESQCRQALEAARK